MGDLEGRTALITGASRGIGAASALSLAKRGARVALAARTRQTLTELAEGLGGQAVVLECDLGEVGAASDLAERAIEALGGVDILVNNAASNISRRAESFDEDQVDGIFNLNVRAVLLLSAALIESIAGRGHGSIVNISSIAARVGSPFNAPYAASKAGVEALTRSLAAEWGPRGVRVNAVAPGVIITQMWERGREIPGLIEAMEGRIALRRWGQPDEVADVVAFLASDDSRYITGECLTVDGGQTMLMEPQPRPRGNLV